MKIETAESGWKQFEVMVASSWVAIQTAVTRRRKQLEVIAASRLLAIRTAVIRGWRELEVIAASNWIAVPVLAILAVVVVFCFYVIQNSSGRSEPFGWLDGASAWPSITIILFAGLLSVHFIVRTQVDLSQNADTLRQEFALRSLKPKKTSLFGWEVPPEILGTTRIEDRIDIAALWERYLCRGGFWRRVFRALPMTVLYIAALFAIWPLGDFPSPPIRGHFPFFPLIIFSISLFLFLTFFVIDAIRLHEGFLIQLEEKESYWPDATFQRLGYQIKPTRRGNESDLADYWDILLISKRTEAVGSLIYYPFIILSLLIVARLNCFDNWTWTPALILVLSTHFSLALYAAWRLPRVATVYRDKVLERLKRRRRQALMLAQRTPEAIDTIIGEVQSTHQGAFSYLWEQPAIRALLLPSGGIGLATLLQFLPH
jgi:hypothetical protein